MKQIILYREDINNPIHPFLWTNLCDELDVPTDSETITLWVSKAEGDGEEN